MWVVAHFFSRPEELETDAVAKSPASVSVSSARLVGVGASFREIILEPGCETSRPWVRVIAVHCSKQRHLSFRIWQLALTIAPSLALVDSILLPEPRNQL